METPSIYSVVLYISPTSFHRFLSYHFENLIISYHLENKNNSALRTYRLGTELIKEIQSYDLLGLKNNCLWRNRERTETGGGASIKACSMIIWAMVVPIVTFAFELWVLNYEDMTYRRFSNLCCAQNPTF